METRLRGFRTRLTPYQIWATKQPPDFAPARSPVDNERDLRSETGSPNLLPLLLLPENPFSARLAATEARYAQRTRGPLRDAKRNVAARLRTHQTERSGSVVSRHFPEFDALAPSSIVSFAAVDPFSAPREDMPIAAPPPDWPVLYARRATYALYLVALLSGFALFARPTDSVQLLTAVTAAWVISYCCALDARAHRMVFPHSFWLITSMTWPVAPLVHLVRVRGFRGFVIYVIHAVAVCICLVLGGALAQLLSGH